LAKVTAGPSKARATQSAAIAAPTLTFRPVSAARRRDFETLFASPGAPHYCWCMAWRRTPEETKQLSSADAKRQMMQRIGGGVPVGLLAYADGAPTAWVSIAPRDTFRRLGGRDAGPDESVWSLSCFFVPRKLRGHGTVHRLLEAAIDHARKNGATVVEGYPVDETSPSYRHMGFVSVFRNAGFVEAGEAGRRRHVMRLKLR
jgi:GNAT superfamily N-acetyltransferase